MLLLVANIYDTFFTLVLIL